METRLTRAHAAAAPLGPGRPVAVAAGTIVFNQGDAADAVFQVVDGRVQLSMLSTSGRNAIVATLGPGSFLGEVMLLEPSLRTHTATAVTACRLVAIAPHEMRELLHSHPDVESQFIGHMLRRIDRLDADLADLLFHSAEQRLARALLLLAENCPPGSPRLVRVSQEALSDMIGTTRSRVNLFLKKFKALGFVGSSAAGITVRPELINACDPVAARMKTRPAAEFRADVTRTHRARVAPASAHVFGRASHYDSGQRQSAL